MSRHPLKFLSWWLPVLLLLLATTAYAAEIKGAGWQGFDFVMYCSDSTGYHIDLATSDSSQLVIYIDAKLVPQLRALGAFSGPNNLQTIITESSQGGVRLSVIAPGRMGYSTIWRPYSHRLVIHTFLWNALSYTTEQYHKGLLALEQNLDRQAEEFLGISFATGEDRAGSALGVRYEQRGADSLALRYLVNPLDADDYAALANIQERGGDTKAANLNRQSFHSKLDNEISTAISQVKKKDTAPSSKTGIELLSNPSVVAIAVGVLLVLMILVTWVIRRSSRIDHEKSARRPEVAVAHDTPATATTADETLEPPVTTITPTVETPKRNVPEPVSKIEPSIQVSRPQFWSPDIAPPIEEPKPWMAARSTQETPAPHTELESQQTSSENPFLSKQTEKLDTPSIAKPVQLPKTIEPEPEPRITPGLSAFELRTGTEKFDAASESKEIATLKPELQPSPQPAETEAAPAQEIGTADTAAEPAAPQRKLSVQAQQLQQKIKSHRSDVPAPSEPTVSAARRLNLSRDNVELRKMMEQALGKRGESETMRR